MFTEAFIWLFLAIFCVMWVVAAGATFEKPVIR